jgi:hypothetical protein
MLAGLAERQKVQASPANHAGMSVAAIEAKVIDRRSKRRF